MEFERKEPKSEKLHTRVRKSERKEVEAAAAMAGVTVAEFVRVAAREAAKKLLAAN